jgi:hypothetical protein
MQRKKFSDDFESQELSSELSELDTRKPSHVSLKRYLHNYYLVNIKQKLLLFFCCLFLIFGLFFHCQDLSSSSITASIDRISNYDLLKDQLQPGTAVSYYATTDNQRRRKCVRNTISSSFVTTRTKLPVSVIVYAGQVKHQHPGYANFLSSLTLSGFTDIVMKEPPDQEILAHTGPPNNTLESLFWVHRLEEFQRVAFSASPDQLLLICDSFDVLFGLSIDIFLSRFNSLTSDIIFSTEMLCDTISCRNDNWLTEWFTQRNPNPHNPYQFLNAGLLVGKAHSLNLFFQCSLKYAKNGRDDQTAFALCFHEFQTAKGGVEEEGVRVELDYDSLLFGNIPPIDTFFDHHWSLDEEKHLHPDNLFHIPQEEQLTPTASDQHRPSFLSRLIKQPNTEKVTMITPVAVHFPGMAYRPSYTLFNPCQQFLRWRYNQLGHSSFLHGEAPNIFHPRPIISTLHSLTNETRSRHFNLVKRAQEYQIALGLVVEYRPPGDSTVTTRREQQLEFFDELYKDLYGIFEHNRYVYLSTLYLFIILPTHSTPLTLKAADLMDRLREFEEFVQLEIILVNDKTDSLLGTILQKDSDASSPSLIIMQWLKIASSSPLNLLDSLYQKYLLDPGAVYGYGGWMIEEEIHSSIRQSGNRFEQWKLRSAGHWHDTITSVDVLDLPHGILFPRSVFDESFQHFLSSTRLGTEWCEKYPTFNDEDVRISAYLSMKAIPRIQLPKDLTQTKRFPSHGGSDLISSSQLVRNTKWGNSNERTSWGPGNCHLSSLVHHFQRSWLTSVDEKCTSNTFQSLRVIDNLPGFSWQLNWDPLSHTSACTTHLLTHASPSASFLGTGQYLSEHHHLLSPQRKYFLRLESGARLCLYSLPQPSTTTTLTSPLSSPIRCLVPPMTVDTSTPHYLALQDGELCFYRSYSPHFGSTKKESGHTTIEWCTSSSYPRRHSQAEAASNSDRSNIGRRVLNTESVTFQAIKDRIKAKVAEVLQKRAQAEALSCDHGGNEIEREYWESVYLSLTDDGIFGLFYSDTSPSDRMEPRKRINTFILAKCF